MASQAADVESLHVVRRGLEDDLDTGGACRDGTGSRRSGRRRAGATAARRPPATARARARAGRCRGAWCRRRPRGRRAAAARSPAAGPENRDGARMSSWNEAWAQNIAYQPAGESPPRALHHSCERLAALQLVAEEVAPHPRENVADFGKARRGERERVERTGKNRRNSVGGGTRELPRPGSRAFPAEKSRERLVEEVGRREIRPSALGAGRGRRKHSRKAKHPRVEIHGDDARRQAAEQRVHRMAGETKKLLRRVRIRDERDQRFREGGEQESRAQVRGERKRRAHELERVEAVEVAALLLEGNHLRLAHRLERAGKRALQPARAARDDPFLSSLLRQKRHDAVLLPQRNRAQDEGFVADEGHVSMLPRVATPASPSRRRSAPVGGIPSVRAPRENFFAIPRGVHCGVLPAKKLTLLSGDARDATRGGLPR